jgi:hypothetical protein
MERQFIRQVFFSNTTPGQTEVTTLGRAPLRRLINRPFDKEAKEIRKVGEGTSSGNVEDASMLFLECQRPRVRSRTQSLIPTISRQMQQKMSGDAWE